MSIANLPLTGIIIWKSISVIQILTPMCLTFFITTPNEERIRIIETLILKEEEEAEEEEF